MSYFYLVLSLSFSLANALILRHGEKNGGNRTVIIAANYIVAGSLGYLLSHKTSLSTPILLYGIVLGLFFFLTFWLLGQGIQTKGLASTVTMSRLSMAVPVLLSILFWGEKPTLADTLGLLLILVIILFWEEKTARISPILLAVFCAYGLINSAMKYFKQGFPKVDNGFFLVILFFSALIWSWSYLLFRRQKVSGQDLGYGLLLGVPNFFSSFFLLQALGSIPAYIAFPFLNMGLIVCSAAIGFFFFKEPLGRKKTVLLILAILAVGLLAG